jgi:hypothetical protein
MFRRMSELLLPIASFEGTYNPPAGILVGPPGWAGLHEGDPLSEALPSFGHLDEVAAQLDTPALVPLGATHAADWRKSEAICGCLETWVAPEVRRRIEAGARSDDLLPLRDALVIFPPRAESERHCVMLNEEVRIVGYGLPAYRAHLQLGDAAPMHNALDLTRLSFASVDAATDGFLWIHADEAGAAMYFNFLPCRDDASRVVAEYSARAAELNQDVHRALARIVLRRQYTGVFDADQAVRTRMAADGWCPSPALLPDAWRDMVAAYAHGDSTAADAIATDAVSTESLDRILREWRAVEPFATDMPLLERGIERYVAGDYISSVAVLLPRLEGLANRTRGLRNSGVKWRPESALASLSALGSAEVRDAWVAQQIAEFFAHAIESFFLRSFPPTDPSVADVLGRHAHAHGATGARHYTRTYALKVIVALDALLAVTQ